MKKIVKKLIKAFHDDRGLTMVEYAVASALITTVALLAFLNLGNGVAGVIQVVASYL